MVDPSAPSDRVRGARVLPALLASVRMLRQRTVVTLGLGAAVVLSLLSVCCGLGLITTPWFMCELFAVQLALCTGQTLRRDFRFVPAASILLGAVLMISAVAALALLGAGMPSIWAESAWGRFDAFSQSGMAVALMSSVMALLLATPWLYAPLILLEEHTRFDVALALSVRLVVTHGLWASLRLSLAAHAVQASPLIVAAGLSLLFDESRLAWFVLLAAPLLCLSVPLGQGMIVGAYVQMRERSGAETGHAADASAAKRRTERCARAWTLLMVLPIASLLLLELSLLRPSRVPPGAAPEGELLAELRPAPSAVRHERALVPNTALEVVASEHGVSVIASDGGGVGELPLRAAAPIERVRVVRVRDALAVELTQAGQTYVTLLDRAGVRLDDSLRARLLDRVSALQLFLFVCALLTTAVASVPVLYALGRAQPGYRLPTGERPSQAEVMQAADVSVRRARQVAVLLLPLSLACLTLAVLALAGT